MFEKYVHLFIRCWTVVIIQMDVPQTNFDTFINVRSRFSTPVVLNGTMGYFWWHRKAERDANACSQNACSVPFAKKLTKCWKILAPNFLENIHAIDVEFRFYFRYDSMKKQLMTYLNDTSVSICHHRLKI